MRALFTVVHRPVLQNGMQSWTHTGTAHDACCKFAFKWAQVGDFAAHKRCLADLQHEAAVYEHLREEQGVSVPRFVASGYILDSTLFFIATEMLGPPLDRVASVAGETLELAALRALVQVHACGVLHR